MPELGEIARAVHFLRIHLVGKTIAKVVAPDDANVFGKVGCSGPAFEKALTGKKIVAAGQQGKYFWLEMEKAPHPLFHFGMTGWLHIKGEQTYYYKRSTPEPQIEWPPKFWKFTLETKATKDSPAVEAAFTDPRRFGRVRLLDCPGSEIRNTTPLKENGPDPIVDKDVVTLEWLTALMRKKHVPVKSILLDQGNISGCGNWLLDELLYNARLHPEQYSDTFSDEQLAQLHKSLMYVCGLAVETLSDSSRFPEDWLFKHRWGKGKKDAPTTLPTGEKIAFLTVGGRTSCIVPSIQKKTGAVAGDVKKGDLVTVDEKVKKGKTVKKKTEDSADEEVDAKPQGRKRKAVGEANTGIEQKPKLNGAKKVKTEKAVKVEAEEMGDRRRSGRIRK